MQPSIIFLGTGSQSVVLGKQLRASGGIVLQADEHQFHIDPGPGALNMAKQFFVNMRETTGVLVSHPHIGHCNDVNAVISAMTHAGLDKRGVLVGNDLLINGDKFTKPYVTEFHKKCLEKYVVLNVGKKMGIDDIEIRATATKHSIDNLGFRILTSQFNMSYLSDTAFTPELLDEHKDSEILILNVVNPFDEKTRYNLNSNNAVKIIEKLRPKLAIITHFSVKMLKVDPLLEARKIHNRTKTQVIAAKDGMVINPLSYSARRKQRSLKSY